MIKKLLSFNKLLIGFPITVSELNDLIKPVAARNWHYLFEFIIRKYDPSLNFNYSKLSKSKEFHNQGIGVGVLKPNRILKHSKSKVFEKIFFNDSPGLRHNLLFKEFAANPLSKNHVKFPEILDIIYGEKFTIFLFEFLDLVKISDIEKYETLKATTFKLLRFQKEAFVCDDIDGETYVIGIEKLKNAAVFTDDELIKLEGVNKSTPVYFQHYDFHENNVFIGDVIIDWDNSGNYHLGADFGILLLSYFNLDEREFFSRYKDEISEYHKNFHLNTSHDFFYLSVIFHFLILFYFYSSKESHYQKVQNVIQECKLKLKDLKL